MLPSFLNLIVNNWASVSEALLVLSAPEYFGAGPFIGKTWPACHCLPKGRHSDGAHEFQGCSSQKCSRGGVGWWWGGSCRGGVGWVM